MTLHLSNGYSIGSKNVEDFQNQIQAYYLTVTNYAESLTDSVQRCRALQHELRDLFA